MKRQWTLLGCMILAAAIAVGQAGYPGQDGPPQGYPPQDPGGYPPQQGPGGYPPQDGQAAPDPPSRVARLNYISGSVSFEPGSVDTWTPATLNYPLTTGDHLWVDQRSDAEMHIGSAAIRLGSETDITFLNLDDRNVQIRLAGGALSVRLYRLNEDENFEIDTPTGAISLLRPGRYRFDASADGTRSRVSVRSGEAEVTAGPQTFAVRSQQSAEMEGADAPSYRIRGVDPDDDWDRWCESRDARADRAQAPRYISREVTGYEDLDQYGSWRNDPGYGAVWVPTVAAGWAPYHYGHWAWVYPWGWTWIDDAPWGFAPFHYGRWAVFGGVWGWVPGPICAPVVVRPVYAPALVAFVGGAGWGVSLAFGGGGGIGWFPLGPRDVYVPAYHSSLAYVNQVNVTHVTNITNINVTNVTYTNRNVPGAVTAVSRENFVAARPVAQAAVRVPPEAARSAPVLGMVAPVAPRTESVLAHPTGVFSGAVARPPAAVANRQVYARVTPAPPRVPFAQHQPVLAAQPGRPVPPPVAARTAVQPVQAAPATAEPGRPVTPGAFGQPGRPAPPATVEPNRPVTPGAPNQPVRQMPPAVVQPNRPAPPVYSPREQPGERGRTYTPPPAAPANQPSPRPAYPQAQPSRPAPAPSYGSAAPPHPLVRQVTPPRAQPQQQQQQQRGSEPRERGRDSRERER